MKEILAPPCTYEGQKLDLGKKEEKVRKKKKKKKKNEQNAT